MTKRKARVQRKLKQALQPLQPLQSQPAYSYPTQPVQPQVITPYQLQPLESRPKPPVTEELKGIIEEFGTKDIGKGRETKRSDVVPELFVLENLSAEEADSFCDIFKTGARMVVEQASVDKTKIRIDCKKVADELEFDPSKRWDVFYGVTTSEAIERVKKDVKARKTRK